MKTLRANFEILLAGALLAAFNVDAAPSAADLLTQQTKLLPISGNSGFGTEFAIRGDIVAVGANIGGTGTVGAVEVFLRNGSVWTQQATLVGNDVQPGAGFASSVAMDGDIIVAGAHSAGSGAAYVFVRNGTNWIQQGKLTASDPASGDFFGSRVAVSGETITVGAMGKNQFRGALYVFVRNGTNWVQQRKITEPTVAQGEYFGEVPAVHGDTIAVGVYRHDLSASLSYAGAIYVYVRTGTNWSFQQKLTANPPGDQNFLGWSMAIDGDTIVAGARGRDDGGTDTGAVYIFARTNGVWFQRQKLNAFDAAAFDGFGYSVGLAGDLLAVGSSSDDDAGPDAGSAYVYERLGTTWVFRKKLFATDSSPGRNFGRLAGAHGQTILLGGSDGLGGRGLVYVFAPGYADPNAVAQYANKLLYYPAATGSQVFLQSEAAFRYKHLLYGIDPLDPTRRIRARLETMSSLYGPAERARAALAEEEVLKGLARNPAHSGLGQLLLDIYYDRTAAEAILAREILAQVERARLDDPPSGGFVIDNEIGRYEQALATNRLSLARYFDLFTRELLVQPVPGTNTRWATRVLGFSSQWTTSFWSAAQTLGTPNTYPAYASQPTAWASLTENGQREFLELGYDNPMPIDSVSIYETQNPGAVDRVAVRSSSGAAWQTVWTGTAQHAGNVARIFTVRFPATTYPVSEIRFELNSPAVAGWNEIDAASISGPAPTLPVLQSNFGYKLFQNLAPGRALQPATYETNGQAVPVVPGGTLFSGYKDLVLLFDLLREHGRTAATLARLKIGRNNAGDVGAAQTLLAEAQRFLFIQGSLLQGMFPALPPVGDPSGIAEAIEGWAAAIADLATIQQALTGNSNLLGFADDFLMFIQRSAAGPSEPFDSYDTLRNRLNPESSLNSLGFALQLLQQARTSYTTYVGYQDQLAEQFANSSVTYEDRLRDIVGAFPDPGDPNYSEIPDANPGSELDQQYRSIEVANLRIQRNQAEIENVGRQVQIELSKAANIAGVVIQFGEKQAQLTAEIGTIEALQAEANALANAFTPDKLITGLAFVDIANGAAQLGLGAWKAQLQADKERQAALEHATIIGLETDALVKTLLLQMNTLAIDSQEAALLLQQEINRLMALYREKRDLERKLAEREASLASRYFADPIHRVTAQDDMIEANHAFAEAQKWLFFMVRALEYKWNRPFTNVLYLGKRWSSDTLFKLRNAEELELMYRAMVEWEQPIADTVPKGEHFDWFSVREDFFGYKPGTNASGQPLTYVDPDTGAALEAIPAFRNHLRRLLYPVLNGEEIRLEFSTARQIPGGSFFVGPIFDTGQPPAVIDPGKYLDKIDYLQIRLPGNHPPDRTQLAGRLTYGGTSYTRNQRAGRFDPARPDRLRNELAAFSTRFWYNDGVAWRFTEALTISDVFMELAADPRVPSDVAEIHEFKERSVAATGWKLVIPTIAGGERVLDIDHLDDVEIYFHHYSAQRLP